MHTSQLSRRGLTPGDQSLARGAAASKIGCSFSAMAMLPPIFSLRIRKACRGIIHVGGQLGQAALTLAETAALLQCLERAYVVSLLSDPIELLCQEYIQLVARLLSDAQTVVLEKHA